MRPLKPPLHRTGGETIPADVVKAAVRMATLVAYDPVQTKVVCRLKQVGDWLISLRMLDGEITLTYTSLVPKGIVTGAVALPLYSGVVYGGRIKRPTEEELEQARLEKRPVPPAKLLSYQPSANAVAEHRSYKFRLYAPVEFPPLAIQPEPGPLRDPPVMAGPAPRYVASQYKRMRPTHFTGAMRQVVQYRMGCPDIVTLRNGVVVSETGTPGEEEHAGRIRYSFGWDKTHGLYTAPDETRWVLEISRSGVRAWVLPVLLRTPDGMLDLRHPRIGELPPETRGPQAERVYAALGATQQELFEQQGWLPLGDDPVDAAEFAVAEAAGMACRPADATLLAPFYNNAEPYFDACGWAFSTSGALAANTCFTVDPASTFRRARYMQLKFSGGERKPDKTFAAITCSVMESYERWLVGPVGAIYFPKDSILPGGVPSLSIIQTRPRSWPAQPPSPQPKVAVDVVVYCYFDGETEVRVRASYGGRDAEPAPQHTKTTSGSMQCSMGTTTTKTVQTYVGKPGGVYTTHYDDRQLPEGNSTVETTSSIFHGWTGQSFNVEADVDCWGSCSKTGVVEVRYRSEALSGRSFGQAVYIPAYDREAYFYMKYERKVGVERRSGTSSWVKTSSSARLYYMYDPFWIRVIANYGQVVQYYLVRAKGYRGSLLDAGTETPYDPPYRQYAGKGPIECDPPSMGDACAGPLPSGPENITATPRIPGKETRTSVAKEETVTMFLLRSGMGERKVHQSTQQYGLLSPTMADYMTVFNNESVDGSLGSFMTVDAFNRSVMTADPPYIGQTISEIPGGQRQAFSTTLIGVPNGIRD